MDHAVGHVRDDGVVGDDDGEGAEIKVHPLDGLQHRDAGLHIKGFISIFGSVESCLHKKKLAGPMPESRNGRMKDLC